MRWNLLLFDEMLLWIIIYHVFTIFDHDINLLKNLYFMFQICFEVYSGLGTFWRNMEIMSHLEIKEKKTR